MTKNGKFIPKLDIAEHRNDSKRVGTITAFLPFVSAK